MRGTRVRIRWIQGAVALSLLAPCTLAGGAALLGRVAAAEPERASGAGPTQRVHVDPGALASRVAWRVRVGPGDTLSELAQRHLGSARRTTEVQALNPGIDARSLRVGRQVWLPPARPADLAGWVELYVAADGEAPALAREGEPPLLPAGPVRVFAVPRSRVKELLTPSRDGASSLMALESDPQVAVSEPFEARAAEGRAFARGVTRVRVAALEGRKLALEVLEQSLYSETGHRVPLEAHAALDQGSLAVPLLLLLAGLLAFAAVAWAARRLTSVEASDAPGAGRARS